MSTFGGGAGRGMRFLADQNFREMIVEGLRQRRPEMDIQLARDVGLEELPDPDLLAYCKAQGRLLLTHDKRTMARHLDDFVRGLPAGEHSPGGFVVPQRMGTGEAIEALLLIWEASEPEEWQDRLTFLPL